MLKAKYWHTCPKQQKSQIQINTILCTQIHHTKLLIAILLVCQKGWIVPKSHFYRSADCISFFSFLYCNLHIASLLYGSRFLASLFIQSLKILPSMILYVTIISFPCCCVWVKHSSTWDGFPWLSETQTQNIRIFIWVVSNNIRKCIWNNTI